MKRNHRRAWGSVVSATSAIAPSTADHPVDLQSIRFEVQQCNTCALSVA